MMYLAYTVIAVMVVVFTGVAYGKRLDKVIEGEDTILYKD